MGHEHKICAVAPGSIGEELELAPGDVLLAVEKVHRFLVL